MNIIDARWRLEESLKGPSTRSWLYCLYSSTATACYSGRRGRLYQLRLTIDESFCVRDARAPMPNDDEDVFFGYT